jgi:hypothetical protein
MAAVDPTDGKALIAALELLNKQATVLASNGSSMR